MGSGEQGAVCMGVFRKRMRQWKISMREVRVQRITDIISR